MTYKISTSRVPRSFNQNYKGLVQAIQLFKKKLGPFPSLLGLPHIEEFVSVFGQSVPKGLTAPYSAKYVLDNLQPVEHNKQQIPVSVIKGAIMFIYECNRSKLVLKMTENSRWGSLTPIFMLGAKEHRGYAYDDWDKSDPLLKYLLGSFLEDLVELPAEFIKPSAGLDAGGVRLAREEALTYKTGNKAGTMEKLTSHKMNWYFPNVPNAAKYMVLQTWLAHVSVRNEAMILDPWNWDKIPEPWDLVEVPKNPESWTPF